MSVDVCANANAGANVNANAAVSAAANSWKRGRLLGRPLRLQTVPFRGCLFDCPGTLSTGLLWLYEMQYTANSMMNAITVVVESDMFCSFFHLAVCVSHCHAVPVCRKHLGIIYVIPKNGNFIFR